MVTELQNWWRWSVINIDTLRELNVYFISYFWRGNSWRFKVDSSAASAVPTTECLSDAWVRIVSGRRGSIVLLVPTHSWAKGTLARRTNWCFFCALALLFAKHATAACAELLNKLLYFTLKDDASTNKRLNCQSLLNSEVTLFRAFLNQHKSSFHALKYCIESNRCIFKILFLIHLADTFHSAEMTQAEASCPAARDARDVRSAPARRRPWRGRSRGCRGVSCWCS